MHYLCAKHKVIDGEGTAFLVEVSYLQLTLTQWEVSKEFCSTGF